ncbi:MAG TPA: DUF1015 domain-containing protein [Phycisphaerae bacterium]|nr:DUF1015 domain-containing protein [Phycisphaerae bacterium]
MAHIEPFSAIRYSERELSALVAPPYDILNEADKKALLAKDEHNIVAIDLPFVPPKSAGPDVVYQRAAGEMTSWLDIRCLVRDTEPALYVYHQTYKLGAKTLTRRMFFTRLRLEPFGSGSIFAHEQTFGGPKEDRLKLTIATRCNLSPIFALYPDDKNDVAALLEGAAGREPDQFAVLEEVQNKLWVVTEPGVIADVRAKLADRPVFIADGHHRYSTALMYRDVEIEETGELTPTDPLNFVLAVLCAMEDPGATIQPYFRTIVDLPAVTAAMLRDELSRSFTWAPSPRPQTADELAKLLSAAGPQAIALYVAKSDACAVVAPREADVLAGIEPQRHPAWRKSPYAIWHRYLVDELLTPKFGKGKPPTIHYHKTMQEAIADARAQAGIAALMPATRMDELREICLAGELMPQKSTYFFPKLATGLVINPLY